MTISKLKLLHVQLMLGFLLKEHQNLQLHQFIVRKQEIQHFQRNFLVHLLYTNTISYFFITLDFQNIINYLYIISGRYPQNTRVLLPKPNWPYILTPPRSSKTDSITILLNVLLLIFFQCL